MSRLVNQNEASMTGPPNYESRIESMRQLCLNVQPFDLE